MGWRCRRIEGGKLGVSELEAVEGASPVAPGRKRFFSPLFMMVGEASMTAGVGVEIPSNVWYSRFGWLSVF